MNNIRKIAKQKHISIKSILEKTGLARSHFYKIVSNKTSPNVVTAWKIADVLGESIEQVFPKS